MFRPVAESSLPSSPCAKYLPLSAAPKLPKLHEAWMEDEAHDAAHARFLAPMPEQLALTRPPEASALAALCARDEVSSSAPRLRNKTAILGGSFDPPHWGTAWCVRRLFKAGVRDVWLMPADVHADKSHLSPYPVRYQMLLSLKQYMQREHMVDGQRLMVTNAERFVDSKGQTLEVLREMRRWYPDNQFVLAVGADVGAKMGEWPGAQELAAEFQPVVLERPGGPWRAELHADDDKSVLMSSTEIRSLRKQGQSIAHCAPADIVADIERLQLYTIAKTPAWRKLMPTHTHTGMFACVATLAAAIALASTARPAV